MWSLVILAFAAFVPDAEQEAGRDEARLNRELAIRVAGAPQSCVDETTSRSFHAVSNRTFVYRRGGTIWINRPDDACVGMRPPTTLIVETYGSQICRGDHVRALEWGRSIPGPICVLGDWVPYRRPS